MSAPSEIRDRPGSTPGDAWSEYLRAAQRLDTVRRAAAEAAGEQAHGVRIAQEALTSVRARLAPQQSRLRALGVPESALEPTAAELAAVGAAPLDDPEAVLAALAQARAAAEAADAASSRSARPDWTGRIGWSDRSADWQPFLSSLLIYGTLALAVLGTLVCVGLGAFWLDR